MTELDTARYADLEGAAVFVSGGASGIGADLVEGFCRQGAQTVFVDLDAEAGGALSARLAAETGTRPRFIAASSVTSAAMKRGRVPVSAARRALRAPPASAARSTTTVCAPWRQKP